MKDYRRAFLFVLMAVCLGSIPVSGSSRLKTETCYIEALGENAICGSYEVMENRKVRKGAKIKLNFIILPARTPHPAPDPVFIFSGGPGQGSADLVESYARQYERLRQERAIVLIDQRGTGHSNPLPCIRIGDPDSAQTYLQDMFPEDYVNTCRRALEKSADLRYYHSLVSMQDIDDLRGALGYPQVNIIGASYGSYFGIVYMKAFPQRVRSAFLSQIAIPGWGYPATVAPNTQASLERLIEDCAADPVGSRDYPRLREMLAEVVGRLKQGPVQAAIINPFTGEPETVTFTHNNFIHGVRSLLYTASGSRWIPAFVHWAAQGYYAPIAEYTAKYLRSNNKSIMDGLFLCVTCAETMPYIDYGKAESEAQGTFMGTYRLDQQRRACELWVRGVIAADFFDIPTIPVPTLIVSGEIDPVTPPAYGQELARYLPKSLHIVIPYAGHEFGGVWENCLEDVVDCFISQGGTGGLDAACVNVNRRPAFVSWRDYPAGPPEGISAKAMIQKH